MSKDQIILRPESYLPGVDVAERAGISRLKMGLWYHNQVEPDRSFGEKFYKLLDMVGCNMKDNGNPRSPEGIFAGQEIKYATRGMFEKADLVHVVISSHSMNQESRLFMPGLKGVLDAADIKVPGNIFIVPIRLDDTPLPRLLSGITPLDLFQGDQQEFGKKLIRTWQVAMQQHS